MGHLMELGLLTDAPRTTPEGLMRYQPTPLLHAFVEMLCVTPLPELRWVDPRDVSVIKNATARVAIAAKLHVTPRT